ncbi:MAG: flagellin [Candidatus Gastranaerophilaceae bacterium]
MAITVNTNISSLIAQKSLNVATSGMNNAMERMTTGSKINSSKDDAAGMAVVTKLNYKVSSLNVAQDNGQMGASMLDTLEGVLGVYQSNLQRIRDLTEQAANGTYGTDALNAIKSEVQARFDEITRLSEASEFNGRRLLNGEIVDDIKLQVGITHDSDVSTISLEHSLFEQADASSLIGTFEGKTIIAEVCTEAYSNDTKARAFLEKIDDALSNITDRTTKIGGYQQRILSAIDAAGVMETNLTSAGSLIQDADIAEESSNYIKQQILQQTSATLLATANQTPSIATQLV